MALVVASPALLLKLLWCFCVVHNHCHVFADNGEGHNGLPGGAHTLSWPGASEGILICKTANRWYSCNQFIH